jgi:hypothetical protein
MAVKMLIKAQNIHHRNHGNGTLPEHCDIDKFMY